MQINEHILRIRGSASIPEPLELSTDYEFQGVGQLVRIEEVDNEDGTINKVYVFKPIIITSIDGTKITDY